MNTIPKEHIALFADRIRMLGEVKLASDVIFELFREASQYHTMRFTLEQIANGGRSNIDYAAWAKRTIDDDDRNRKTLTLRYPRRLSTLKWS